MKYTKEEPTVGYTLKEMTELHNRTVARVCQSILKSINSKRITISELSIVCKMMIDDYTPDCTNCEGTGDNYYSCCGDDMRGNDYDICPTCKEHTGWDGERDDECTECNGTGKEAI